MAVISTLGSLAFRVADLPRLPRPDRVVMADPEHFDIAVALNPHMRGADGTLKAVDRARARREWQALRREFERGGLRVDLVEALEGQPDLVFCANPALPIPSAACGDGVPRLVPSNMAHAERRGEVAHVAAALQGLGYRLEPLQRTRERFEGMGDGLWHPGRRLLWGGCGPRSSAAAWEEIAERYLLPIVLLELEDPDFYHLDTCLCLLDEDACLWYPPAIAPRGRELVRALIPRRVEATEEDARARLACNAFCADGRRVWMQRGSEATAQRLREAGFAVVEVETGEFLKSGGSVFCLKLAHGPLR